MAAVEWHTATPLATKVGLRLHLSDEQRGLGWGVLAQTHLPQVHRPSELANLIHTTNPGVGAVPGGSQEGFSTLAENCSAALGVGGVASPDLVTGASDTSGGAWAPLSVNGRQVGILQDWRELKLEREV